MIALIKSFWKRRKGVVAGMSPVARNSRAS